MKKGMKKMMAGMLTGAMVLSTCPTMVFAANTVAPTLDKYGFDWSYEKDNSIYNRVMYFDIYNASGITKLQATFKVEVGGTTGKQATMSMPAAVTLEDTNTTTPTVDGDVDKNAEKGEPAVAPTTTEPATTEPATTEPATTEPAPVVENAADENVVATGLENEDIETYANESTTYYVKVESKEISGGISSTKTDDGKPDQWWFSIDKTDKTSNGDQTVTWYSDADMKNEVQESDLPFKDDWNENSGSAVDNYKSATVKISDIDLSYQKSQGSMNVIAEDLDGLTKTFTSKQETQVVDYFVAPKVDSVKFEWASADKKDDNNVAQRRVLTFGFSEPLDKDIKGLKATFNAKVAGKTYQVEVTNTEKGWEKADVTKWWFSIDKSDDMTTQGHTSDQTVVWKKDGKVETSPFQDGKSDDPKSVTITDVKLFYSTKLDNSTIDYSNAQEIAIPSDATKTNIGTRIFKDGEFTTPVAKTAKFEWNYTHDSDQTKHNRVMRFDFNGNLHKAVNGLRATFDAKVGTEEYTVEVTQSTKGAADSIQKWWFSIDKTDAKNTEQKVVWKQNGSEVTSPFDAEGEQAGKTLKISNVKLFYQTTEDEAATNTIAITQNNIPGTYTSDTKTIAAPVAKTATFKWQYTHDSDQTKHNRVLRFDFDGALNQAVTNLKATFTAVVDNKTQTVTVTQSTTGVSDPIQKWWFSIDKSVNNKQEVTWSDTTPFPNDELYGDKTIKISNLALQYSTDSGKTWNNITITANNAQNTFDKDGVVSSKPSTKPGGSSTSGSGGGASTTTKKDEVKNEDGSTTTTVTDKNGNTTVTETKKDGTVIETVTKKDGTVTETVTETDGTVTETVTGKDGTVTETVTEADGTVTETVKDADGNKVTTVTEPDGTVTETEKKADGSVTETVTMADGTITVTTTDAEGNTTASADISNAALEAAKEKNEPLTIPVDVNATRNSDDATVIDIDMPTNEETKIEIPVDNLTNSTVVVLVHPDGTEEIVKTTGMTENGVTITVSGDVQIKIVNNEKDFDDVDGHWSENDVAFLAARNIMSGVGTNEFGKDTLMTRGMVNTVLARLSGVDTSGGETWYTKGNEWAMENNISDGTNPEGNVTRQQLAAILYRFAGSPAVSGELSFTDAGDVDDYAKNALIWATQNGIISGMGDGTVAPQENATRAQVAAMLARYIRNFM